MTNLVHRPSGLRRTHFCIRLLLRKHKKLTLVCTLLMLILWMRSNRAFHLLDDAGRHHTEGTQFQERDREQNIGINHAVTRLSSPSSNFTCWVPSNTYISSGQFYPKQFLETGPGRSYMPLYQQQQQQSEEKKKKKKKRGPVLNVRFVQYKWTDSCHPLYYHIHKNGGTAMNVKNKPTIVDAYYTPRERKMGREKFRQYASNVMEQVYYSQQKHTMQQENKISIAINMPIFTFLRDPIPRFLSSISQALILNKLSPCSKNNNGSTEKLLDCVLNKINKTQSFLDEHLIPQSFELYSGVMGYDIAITVMDMSHISTILKQLGLVPGGGGEVLTASTSATTTTNSNAVGRGNSERLYYRRRKRQEIVRGYNLSQSILTPSLIERICQIYYMDVLMLRTIPKSVISQSICDQGGYVQ